MKMISILVVTGLLVVSCGKNNVEPVGETQPEAQNGFVDYVIKKGNHYCEQSQLTAIYKNTINARVKFDSSAIYTSVIAENQGDINKLIGFSDCGTEHQQNSARLGWSWNGSKVVIYAYTYVNAQRISKTLGTVALHDTVPCSVRAENNYFYFKAGNYIDSIRRYCTDYNSTRYKLNPYFGGDEVAPHEIHIAIAEE